MSTGAPTKEPESKAGGGGGGGGAAPQGRVIDETKTWGTGSRKIDLRGPCGNSRVLVGEAMAKQVGMPEAERNAMAEDMMSGDYLHVLETFEKHCGTYATLFYGREIGKTKTWGTGPRKIDLRVYNNFVSVAMEAYEIAKKHKMPEAEREAMCEDMLSGDYLHVLETFEKLWGGYATLFYGVRFMRAHTLPLAHPYLTHSTAGRHQGGEVFPHGR